MKFGSGGVLVFSFCATLALLIAGVYTSVSVYQLFDSKASISRVLAAAKDQEAQTAIKYFHAESLGKPFDIGIFGNSRSIMVSESDFDLSNGKTFFNFSSGGSAFVQSVKLIEKLAAAGVAPKTILVSLDHPQIQYTGYAKYPNPVFLLGDTFVDFFTMANAAEGSFRRMLSDAFKVLDWAKDHTWKSFKSAWKSDQLLRRVKHGIQAILGLEVDSTAKFNGFREDGSVVQVLPIARTDFSKHRFGYEGLRGWDRHVYLGMKRLDAVARDHGVKVIVYESPIWPGLESSDKMIRKDAIDTHQWFVAGCKDTLVQCVDAWKLEPRKTGYWPDCCHAPAGDLGYYFRNTLLK